MQTFFGIPQRVKELRKANGLTQKDVADVLGVTPGFISSVESGRFQFTVDHIVCIAKHYKANSHWLLTGEGEMYIKEGAAAAHIPGIREKVMADGKADHPTIGKIVEMLRDMSDEDLKNIEADVEKAADRRKLKIRVAELEQRIGKIMNR